MDGTLVKAWASMKSFQLKDNEVPDGDKGPGDPPDGGASPTSSPDRSTAEPEPMTRPKHRNRNAEVFGHSLGPMAFVSSLRGERRSNATHASATDPEARLFKKSPGAGAMLCFMGHSLMENRSRLIVQAELTQADGHVERRAELGPLGRVDVEVHEARDEHPAPGQDGGRPGEVGGLGRGHAFDPTVGADVWIRRVGSPPAR